MIYSVNFFDMAEKLNPLAVSKYLDETGWNAFPFKRTDIKVYQYKKGNNLYQINIPLEKSLADYKHAMYDAAEKISIVECKSIEQVMLYLLNPNTDILKIRLDKKDMEAGNILFDDAIKLYDNAKKLLAATASDIINPKKIHYGRFDVPVQKFLNQCRFGQTEIGSYVVSVVCPFAELKDEYRQLSIFSDEEQCAKSITRQVTNQLMYNIATIKNKIDSGNIESLSTGEDNISSNFFEALNGLNLQHEDATVEFTAEWSPVVKTNRCSFNRIKITNDYYQPISNIIDRIKQNTNQQTEIVGRIKELKAAPVIDKRTKGTVVVVFVDDKSKAKTATVNLSREDYDSAVDAHHYGKAVRIIGDLSGTKTLKIENAIFNVID